MISMNNGFSLTKPSFFFTSTNLSLFNLHHSFSLSLSNQTQTQNSIVCARNNKRRIGSQRSRKLILESVYFIASNLNILPQPLALAIREFGAGNGGGDGFWKGFGGGGFDGWRRKRKQKLGLFGLLITCGLGMWLLLGKELDSDMCLGVLGISLLGLSINGWRRGVKDWILGFCFCAVVVGLVFRREILQKWSKGLRAMETVRRRKTRRAM